MHKGYSTLIHNTDARAYMVYNEAGKRLAICPYGNGTEDASEDEARKCAMQAYSYLNGTGRDRYYILPCFDEDGKKTKSRTGIFHRKEMPTFNYKPRFSGNQADAAAGTVPEEQSYSKKLKFRKSWLAKRKSMDLEPGPASKGFLYAIVVSLLLLWIFL